MPITEAMRRLIYERKMRENEELSVRAWEVRERVKAAFYEGLAADLSGVELDPDTIWQMSRARPDLYPGPPTPIHKRALMVKRGRYRRSREPGGPGERGTNEHARVPTDD